MKNIKISIVRNFFAFFAFWKIRQANLRLFAIDYNSICYIIHDDDLSDNSCLANGKYAMFEQDSRLIFEL